MTDSEKLDLVLEKISNLENEISDLKYEVKDTKRQQMKYVAELKAMDSMILDEVERVHEILMQHKKDTSKHTA